MIFLAYVIVFGGYLVVAALAVFYLPTRFKDRMKRFGVFVAMFSLFVLAPGGWIYYERSYFDNLCEKEGAVTIYRAAENVDGFIASIGFAEYGLKYFPYKFVEVQYGRNEFYRYMVDDQGKLRKERISLPVSRYELLTTNTDLHFTEIGKLEDRIVDRQTQQVLGTNVTFSRGHNWFKPWLSSGTCKNHSADQDREFIVATLKPATTK